MARGAEPHVRSQVWSSRPVFREPRAPGSAALAQPPRRRPVPAHPAGGPGSLSRPQGEPGGGVLKVCPAWPAGPELGRGWVLL